jgi:hypothetical protein
MTSASSSIVSGVSWAGLTTIVHPAATAGPILRVPIASGKFHGVIISVGPTGCFIVSSREAPLGATEYRPWMRTASSANQRKNSAPYATSPRASATVLPISRLIRVANSSVRATRASKARRRISLRSRGGVAAQVGWASWAAASAASPSSGVPSAHVVRTAPDAGSLTSKRAPPLASRQDPPMSRRVGTDSTSDFWVNAMGCPSGSGRR